MVLVKAAIPGAPIDYTYDDFGNLVGRTGLEPLTYEVDLATNRVVRWKQSPTQGYWDDWTYDGAGNVLHTFANNPSAPFYTYDTMNRLATYGNFSVMTNSYDADGLRVRQAWDQPGRCDEESEAYVRDAAGNVLSQYRLLTTPAACAGGALHMRDYVYLGGEVVGSVENASLAAPAVAGWMDVPHGMTTLYLTNAPANECRSGGMNLYRRLATAPEYDFTTPHLTASASICPASARLTDTVGTDVYCYVARAVHHSGELGPATAELCTTTMTQDNCAWPGGCSYTPPPCPTGTAVPQTVRHWYFNDHLGTPRQVVRGDGTVVDQVALGPFGETVDGNAIPGCHQRRVFTGHEQDAGWLTYMKARYYGSNVGKFLAADPLRGEPGRPATWNRYTYALNNPMRYVDPLGLAESETDGQGEDKEYSCDEDPTRPECFVGPPEPLPTELLNFIPYDPPLEQVGGPFELLTFGVVGLLRLPGMFLASSYGGTSVAVAGQAAAGVVAGEAATGAYSGLTRGQIAAMIAKDQIPLLVQLFKTQRLPDGLTRSSLEAYREIARLTLKEGIDKQGIQASRLALIEALLKNPPSH